jgi:predicted nucleic acid-binding protein
LSLSVDAGVWALALRRDSPAAVTEVQALIRAIEAARRLLQRGLVLQEILQGFSGPKARVEILDRFSAVPLLVPDRDDHIHTADLRNRCRRAGIRIGTIDALLAQLCMRHDLVMLSTDNDFKHVARQCPLKLWRA